MQAGAAIMKPRRRKALLGLARLGLAMAACVLTLTATPALAQYANCVALQSEIANLGRQTSPQAARYQAAAQKQQAELARTIGYAQTIGCNRQSFLFFGDPPPPQCAALNQRIAAMRGNLNQLQAAAQSGGEEPRRRALVAQFDAYCRNQVAARPGGFFDQLFGREQELPIGPMPEFPGEELDEGPRRGSMAVCVRRCDGGFFPVSYSANRSNLDDLAELCNALCPNTKTTLFTKRQDAEIDNAMSYEGESYESLSNAGKFKTKFDPACTCKPPNRSWAAVLADAEKLLANKNKRDLIVTPQKAEELSRPKFTAANAALPVRSKPADPLSEEDRAVAVLEREGKIEAAAASRDNAGITPGQATAGQRYGVTEGRREEITGLDGARRNVRVIGPRY